MTTAATILVTGAAGYIASHVCLELLQAGYKVVALDNLSNASRVSLQRVEEISGRSLDFVEADILDRHALVKLFGQFSPDAVMHFAGLKAVGESVRQPLRYYRNNVGGSLTLFEVMAEAGCHRLVFSSSATVYGDPARNPIDETFPLRATNPYGETKLQIERILQDLHSANPDWQVSILRYFNPVGAHESGRIGEDPADVPNNLMPYIAQVASGRRPSLRVFGDDYPTVDGTGVRDYIHVVDLARGHLCALAKLEQDPGCLIHNLGTGRGYSVLEMVRAFEAASGVEIPYEVLGRREGDIAECYADPTLAEQDLGWKAEKSLTEMCRDAWNWQSNNPDGY